MFQVQDFYLFLTVSLLINLSPGPDMIYTMARTISQGKKGGIYSALGIFAGCCIHLLAAAAGLSLILTRSAWGFELVKLLGSFYLVYLGVRTLIKNHPEVSREPPAPVSTHKIFLQAFLTNLLNPKVAIFYLSFLPQFIHPLASDNHAPILFLGMWFALQGTIILIIITLLISRVRIFLLNNARFRKWQEKITGLTLVALGIHLLLQKKVS